MEYVQERVTTLHDLTDPTPDAPTDRSAVVIPMTEREYAGLAAERTLSALEAADPASVVVPLRVPADHVAPFREWLDEFDLPVEVLWCNGPVLEALLDEKGLNGQYGKGRDVWLALGVAAERADFVACVDADAKTFSAAHVPRLLFPLTDHEFSKGYYARVENDRLYGRLFRLLYVPLVRTLAEDAHAPILDYLESFRYALAGEFAVTADLARSLRVQRSWGLEVGTLGDAFDAAGFEGTAQVDLGRHEHDHKAVGGPTGLSEMSGQVADAILRVVEEHGVDPGYDDLRDRYLETAVRVVEQYAADAAFNDLEYDRPGERDQVSTYAEAITPPGDDQRLPPWTDAPIVPEDVRAASQDSIQGAER